MTIWHCHAAISLDGMLARPDGAIDWLTEDYMPDEALGFDAFLASVDAILMGRDTYDVIRAMGEWPHPDKPVTVMTHRPMPGAPAGVEARSGDLAAVVTELEGRGHRRIWVEGGGKLVLGLMALGKIDVIELAVIPIVLGAGLPLFPEGSRETRFALESGRPWVNGAMHLIYRRIG